MARWDYRDVYSNHGQFRIPRCCRCVHRDVSRCRHEDGYTSSGYQKQRRRCHRTTSTGGELMGVLDPPSAINLFGDVPWAATPTRMYVPLARIDATNSGSALASIGQLRGYTLRDAQNDHIGTGVDFPSNSHTYNVQVHWVNRSQAAAGQQRYTAAEPWTSAQHPGRCCSPPFPAKPGLPPSAQRTHRPSRRPAAVRRRCSASRIRREVYRSASATV